MIRSYLFLQGVSSPFFSELGRRLITEGHRVAKVNFTGGDAFYWKMKGATNFRKNAIDLPAFYDALFEKLHHCTDIILFGDCRPIHSAIVAGAKLRGKRIHVYEEGYFRPFWITLERDGVNGASRLPRDPDWYRHVGKSVPSYQNGTSFTSSFSNRAWHDVQYHIWSALNPVLYPGYQTHSLYSAPSEYFAYIRKATTYLHRSKLAQKQIGSLVETKTPFFLLPLQLDSDAQIRDYSRYSNMSEVIAEVMQSFASNVTGDSRLVIKSHPLDPGMICYRHLIKKLASMFGVKDRIVFLEGGHLPTLLNHASGVVTVNSTVGASALIHKVPTVVLGTAIYDINGLTFQGALSEFWKNLSPPDMRLFRYFRNTVIHTTQVNGGFYSKAGISLAVDNSLNSLTCEQSLLEGLLS